MRENEDFVMKMAGNTSQIERGKAGAAGKKVEACHKGSRRFRRQLVHSDKFLDKPGLIFAKRLTWRRESKPQLA